MQGKIGCSMMWRKKIKDLLFFWAKTQDRKVLTFGVIFSFALIYAVGTAARKSLGKRGADTRKLLKKKGILSNGGKGRFKFHQVVRGWRGRIFDRSRVVLAQTGVKYALMFTRTEKMESLKTIQLLSINAGIPEEKLLGIISANRKNITILPELTEVEAESFKRLLGENSGFRVVKSRVREVLEPVYFTSIVGIRESDGRVLFGIERSFDKYLKASSARFAYMTTPAHRYKFAVDPKKAIQFNPQELDGADVVLTVDYRYQKVAQIQLSKQVARLRAKGGAAVVLDPHTFEVLAMATVPVMEADVYHERCGANAKKDVGSSPCTNKAFQFPYEPGSVGKVFTLITALKSGLYKLDSMVDTHGGVCSIGRFKVKDDHHFKSRWVTLKSATKYSSNCAYSEVGRHLGPAMLYSGLKALGIGSKTGIELPGEFRGLVWPLRKWKKGITDATVAYGYGFTATPLEIVRVMAAIANKGMMGRVSIVKKVEKNGKIIWRPEQHFVRVMSSEVAKAVKQAMISVTEKGGTGVKARWDDVCVAGKTGTARHNIKGHGYGNYIATFAGFVPCDNPQLAIVVTVIDPRYDKFGGQAAAPVFREIAKRILRMKAEDGD